MERFLGPEEPTTELVSRQPTSPPQIPTYGDEPVRSGEDYGGETDDESDGEFEFPFVSGDSPAGDAAADELFADGRIRAFYPVFGRAVAEPLGPALPPRRPLQRLFLEEERNSSVGSTSSSSSAVTDAGDLEGVSPDSYCVWTPGSSPSASSSPSRRPRKSCSTGSMARWRRISELVIGRSHSDGEEKFVFLSAPQKDKDKDKDKHTTKSRNAATGKFATEVDTVTASHRMAHVAKSGGGLTRRTFLPYRPELVGLFANVNGLRRSHNHPF